MAEHKHKWHFAGIQRFSNHPDKGTTQWACECGAVKTVEIKND